MLRILFTNVRGLTEYKRRAGFNDWIGKMGVQVVCVAEIKHPLQTTKGWHCVCHPQVKTDRSRKNTPAMIHTRLSLNHEGCFQEFDKFWLFDSSKPLEMKKRDISSSHILE